MNPDAITSDGSYTFEWNDISRTVQWDATPAEWAEAWKSSRVYTSPHTTQVPSPIWDKEMVTGPRRHVCVLCGGLDASPVCEECRIIFNEFKAYFKKRQFKELMDELAEMDE